MKWRDCTAPYRSSWAKMAPFQEQERPMCGIVAAAAGSNIVSVLIEGLKKLEYRG